MPITILNKEYIDVYGNSLPFYQSNAGDKIRVKYKVLEQILVISNAQNVLSLNFLENTITWSSGNWLKEGFAVGDGIIVRKYDQLGNLIASESSTIVSIYGTNYNILKVNDLDPIINPNIQNQEIVAVATGTAYRAKEIVATINHTSSQSQGSEYSLIDGEATVFRFKVGDVAGFPLLIPNNSTLDGEAVGKHSGQFDVTAKIIFSDEQPSDVGYGNFFGFVYFIEFEVINSGIYDEAWFNFNQCLKLHQKFEYAREIGQPFNRNIFYITDDANTGWFNEAFNVGVIDAEVVQGIPSLSFDTPTTTQIVVQSLNSPIADVGIGACYIPQDEDYYKNKIPSQSTFAMCIPSTPIFATPMISPANPDGAFYQIDVVSAVPTGNTWTIDIIFTPNANFDEFMASREDGDRTFYVWVQIGSQNLLVFDSQLESNPPIGGLIDMVSKTIVDHHENIVDSNADSTGYEANIEDDLAFIGKFRLEEYATYESMGARIRAYNPNTLESFTLTSAFFTFDGIPKILGKYQLNQSQPVNSIPLTTSVKNNALFTLDSSIDVTGEYGVKIYFPFVYRWENWLEQSNASDDFYPNQTKNWFPYGNTGDWQLELYLILVKDNLGYTHQEEIIIKDYDSDANIKQTIEIIRDLDNSVIPVVVDGEMHTIRATHELIDGSEWSNPWGMITIEPTESSPRWVCSTAVPYDFNSQNPLTPVGSPTLMTITYLSANKVQFECKFDANKINLEKGCKFTTKIKGCSTKINFKVKATTDNKIKITTGGKIKVISV